MARRLTLLVTLLLLVIGTSNADSAPLAPAVSKAELDSESFTQWVDGTQAKVEEKNGPAAIVWLNDQKGAGSISFRGVSFGEGKKPGPRHLRVGFKRPIGVGTVVVGGRAKVSVLKPDAAYPGDLADDSQWVAAERLNPEKAVGEQGVVTWVLPKVVATRAIRLTHIAEPTDKTYNGHVNGLVVLGDRFANVAPQAMPTASGNEPRFALLNNSNTDNWGAWDNWDEKNPPLPVKEKAAWVMLTWPTPISLRGLAAVWAGMGAAEVQAYTGPADRHPSEGKDADWQTIFAGNGYDSYYPLQFGPHLLDFGKTVTTRAVRLKITAVTKEAHPHLKGRTQDGRRVWLGELLAFAALDDKPLNTAVVKVVDDGPQPPIPISFTLKEPGYVTLVIEDSKGKRVRNLVSETWFPAGKNEVRWDGLDDLGRDPEAYKHGIYSVPGKPVAPGEYTVRGLWGPTIDLRYEFPVYTNGNPAWQTADHTGGWLSNHTPPMAACCVPADRGPGGKEAVYLGSYVSEGTHGLAWVDLDGKKLGGVNWIGGAWTGAPLLARDDGPKALPGVHVYVGSVWETEKKSQTAEARLTAMTKDGERIILRHRYEPSHNSFDAQGRLKAEGEVGGLAVRDGRIVMSLPRQNKLIVVNASDLNLKTNSKDPQREVRTLNAEDPRGLAFDNEGRMLLVAGEKVYREVPGKFKLELLIAGDLEDPHGIALDAKGNIYVSDWGMSHQVKAFAPDGKLLRTIGEPGGPQTAEYNPNRMHHPFGLTIDSKGRLWVAERDEQPKRVSVWSPEGKLEKQFLGPMEYGGGGMLDPLDKTRFYYLGMEFKLDWEKGTSSLKSIYNRHEHRGADLPFRAGAPVEPLYRDGKQFFTNAYHSSPTGGHGSSIIWRMEKGEAVPCAAAGRAEAWPVLLTEPFADRWPEKPNKKQPGGLFLWVDANSDGKPQPNEVTIRKGQVGGVGVLPDLSFAISRFDGKAVRIPATLAGDRPQYSFDKMETVADGVQGPKSSGGDQVLVHPDGWSVLTLGVQPFAAHSICGVFNGEPRWQYPNLWPGLHASHEAPIPDRPGELTGPTRLLGGFVTPAGDAGPLWVVNGNLGSMYLFTADGLFVRTLFRDEREGKRWSMASGAQGMLLNDVSAHGENFWPSITQTKDGQVFLVDGARGSLVRVDHLDKLRRLPDQKVSVTRKELDAAAAYLSERERLRQARQGAKALKVAIRSQGPTVDGDLSDWKDADWATIDKRGVKAWFNSDSKPYDAAGAVAVDGDRLYAAYRCGEKDLLRNSGEALNAPFKTGGALDLMLATDPNTDPKRTQPAVGDARLLVTLVPDGKKKGATRPLTLLYRPVVSDGKKESVPFSSPWRTITFDRVDDVTSQLQFAEKDGSFEFSVPLAALGLKPAPGLAIKGDIGLLRGNGFETAQRVYWSNKATGIVNDVPSEAALTPHLWGKFEFVRNGE